MTDYAATIHDLIVDTTTLPTSDEVGPGRNRRVASVLYAHGKRQIERQDRRERIEQIRAGLRSYCFAVMDGSRWRAVVMLNTAPNRFRRKLSVALFDDGDEAMRAAERWRTELEKPR